MELGHLDYAVSDAFIFVKPVDAGDRFRFSLPTTQWHMQERNPWTHCIRSGKSLPLQGWKIHVSTVPEEAQEALDTVADYCFDFEIAFKFLGSTSALTASNSKYAARGSSGKFMTLYPTSDGETVKCLTDLQPLLKHLSGPYVLTDLRWMNSTLYTRFGAYFDIPSRGSGDGPPVASIVAPDGELEPDDRSPRFTLPSWVTPPPQIMEIIHARSVEGKVMLPFVVDGAIQFSNGGGVYLARYAGQDVILKEARPYAGIDGRAEDAIARLRRERDILDGLRDVRGVPCLIDYVRVWEHEFLIMERLAGRPLRNVVASDYPINAANGSGARLDTYAQRISHIIGRARAIIGKVHDAGFVSGDLSPNNVLISDDDEVHIIDWEGAGRSDSFEKRLTTPGFRAPASLSATDQDLFALERIELFCHVPIGAVLDLAPGLEKRHREFAGARFARRHCDSSRDPSSAAGHFSHPSLGELGVVAEVTVPALVEGIGRLWAYNESHPPLSVDGLQDQQFTSLWSGLGGVVAALRRAGHPSTALEERFVDSLLPCQHTKPGLMSGVMGEVFVLDCLGVADVSAERAAFVADSVATSVLDATAIGYDLKDGLAGVLTAFLLAEHLGLPWADAYVVNLLRDRFEAVLGSARTRPVPKPARAGFFTGWSGVSFAHSLGGIIRREHGWFSTAAQALSLDLRACDVWQDDGSLQVRDGERYLPYLGIGSAGILLGSSLLPTEVSDKVLDGRADDLFRAITSPIYVCCGLTQGRAGMITTAKACTGFDRNRRRALVDRHTAALTLHVCGSDQAQYAPGDHNLRFTTDYATGGAGLLSSLTAAFDDPFGWFPADVSWMANRASESSRNERGCLDSGNSS